MMVQASLQLDIPSVLIVISGLGMLILELVSMLVILPLFNNRLRRTSVIGSLISAPSDIIAPPISSDPRETNGLDS